MFDQIGINVENLEASKSFYEKALQSLGFRIHMEWPDAVVGFGKDRPIFWTAKADTNKENGHPHSTGVHIAFTVDERDVVDSFYSDALAAGGKDNGAPGVRAEYNKDYYAAFVYDLDGNNVEVVCHKPVN